MWRGISSIVNRQSKIVNLLPLCLSSHRSDFVNHQSSVRVRPGAPAFALRAPARRAIFQGRDVIVSISACDADCAGANPVALTILFGDSFCSVLTTERFKDATEVANNASGGESFRSPFHSYIPLAEQPRQWSAKPRMRVRLSHGIPFFLEHRC